MMLRPIVSYRPRRLPALVLLAFVGAACHSDRIAAVDVDPGTHHVAARAGELVDIHLWAGGGGEYASPPAISTPAVAFVDVD